MKVQILKVDGFDRYISELSPSPFRGQLVTLSILFITLGQVIAYVIGYLFSSQPHGWRWMVGLGALPAAVQAILLFPLPESPRWLVKADKTDAARMVLDRVFGKGQEAQRISDRVLRGIAVEIQEEEAWRMRQRIHQAPTKYYTSWLVWIDQGWTELFRVPGNRRALAIACVLQALQQLCGFNSLMYFAATIFSFVGFTSPTLTALSIASTNFIFTLLALLLIDRVGRRKILLYSIPPMAVGLCLCAFAFFFIHIPDPTESVHASDENGNIAQSRTAALTVLVSLILYVAGYALGLGNVPWQQSELFPLSVRSIGSSISTSTNWGSNFIVGLTFLPMLEFLTPMVTFTTYAGVCIAGWLLIRRIYPETKGMSLEEVGGMLAEGWGVDESLRRVGSR
jgi:SP family myo-inositol transporter-like MFS transporter 13